MKEYIDLTQLPANEIDNLVMELNHNDISGLRRFFERLGLLYGHPLEELVDVFSKYLMLDKHRLAAAFDYFSFKHAVEMLRTFLNTLSIETCPLSTVETLSDYLYSLSGDIISNDIRPLSDWIASLDKNQQDLSGNIQEISSYVYVDLSSVPDLDAISGIMYNGSLVSVDNRIAYLSGLTKEELENSLSTVSKNVVDVVQTFVNAILESVDKDKLSKTEFYAKMSFMNARIKALEDILPESLFEAWTKLLIDHPDIFERTLSSELSLYYKKVEVDSFVNTLSGSIQNLSDNFVSKEYVEEISSTIEDSIIENISGDISSNISTYVPEIAQDVFNSIQDYLSGCLEHYGLGNDCTDLSSEEEYSLVSAIYRIDSIVHCLQEFSNIRSELDSFVFTTRDADGKIHVQMIFDPIFNSTELDSNGNLTTGSYSPDSLNLNGNH